MHYFIFTNYFVKSFYLIICLHDVNLEYAWHIHYFYFRHLQEMRSLSLSGNLLHFHSLLDYTL